jgi:para-aminobenzoate synthetase/4-amino-4-deoxychorismate lyase
VFSNERGELTEGSITSLFVERAGILYTPPLSSGLLAGTLRAELLATGRARESVLYVDDLRSAEAVYLGNSVRGLVRAIQVAPASNRRTG